MTGSACVLVVDDSAAIRTMLHAVLTAAGWQVATACGARDALRLLRSLRPDVILTDYNMPGLNGHDFVRLLRRKSRFIRTPVFVISSEEAADKRRLMQRAGVGGWFVKPIDPIDLLGRLAVLKPVEARVRDDRPYTVDSRCCDMGARGGVSINTHKVGDYTYGAECRSIYAACCHR